MRKNSFIMYIAAVLQGRMKPYVGADDSVRPLGSCKFAEDFRKNAANRRVDVGIGYYVVTSKIREK